MSPTPTMAALLLLAAAPAVAAQGLVDPTRPPVISVAPAQQAAAEPRGPELQSVLLSPSRKIAVINGRAVALGDKVGEATLVRVSETEAELKQGRESTVLKLYPSVRKEPVRPSAAELQDGARGEKGK